MIFISGNIENLKFSRIYSVFKKIKQFLENFVVTRGVFQKILSLIILFFIVNSRQAKQIMCVYVWLKIYYKYIFISVYSAS